MTVAWPFLVSKNNFFDYRVVVAPEFMVADNSYGAIANHINFNVSDNTYSQILTINDQRLTLVFRVSYATTTAGNFIYDKHGRRILFVEGILLKGDHREILLEGQLFVELHQKNSESFKLFWREGKSSSFIIPSKPIKIDTDNKYDALRRLEEEYDKINHKITWTESMLSDLRKEKQKNLYVTVGGIIFLPVFCLGLLPLIYGIHQTSKLNKEIEEIETEKNNLFLRKQNIEMEISRQKKSLNL